MANGAAANERLRDLIHLDRRLHASVDAFASRGRLKRGALMTVASVPMWSARDAVHVLAPGRRRREKIAATHHDRELHAQSLHVAHFGRNSVDAVVSTPKP